MTNWTELRLTKGLATDVPRQIASLASADIPTRDGATKAIFETLVHAGETSEAAAAALELLLPMVTTCAPNSHRAAWVLGEVFAAGHLERLAGKPPTPSNARDAVLAHSDVARIALLSALGSEDPAWRSCAAFALSFVPDVDPVSLLSAARSERAPLVRTSMCLALGVLGRDGEGARHALAALTSEGLDPHPLTLARAIAGESLPASLFAKALVAHCLAPPDRELCPWGGLVEGTFRFVEALVPSNDAREALSPALAEALVEPPRNRTDPRRPQLAKLVLSWSGLTRAYPPKHVARVETLTPALRKIAELFATDDSLGVAATGFAGNARALRRWLGDLPPGPLEGPRPDGEPRWVAARALIAAGRPFPDVLAALTDGLSVREKLDALTELLRGAYRITWDAQGRIPPEALAEVAGARDEAVAWACALVHEVVSQPEGIRDFRTFSGFADGHLMVALLVLVRAGVALEPGVERQVPLHHPLAREVLAALPAASVQRAMLERWRTQALANPAARGAFITEVMPLFDAVGSPELAREMLVSLEASPGPGLPRGVLETLSREGRGLA